MLLVFELETVEEFVVWLGAGSLVALAIEGRVFSFLWVTRVK